MSEPRLEKWMVEWLDALPDMIRKLRSGTDPTFDQHMLVGSAKIRRAIEATLEREAEPVGYVTSQDLGRIIGPDPMVPSVNVWAEPQDGDHALYLAPKGGE